VHAPQRLARIAGLLYLIVGIGGAFAEVVRVTVYEAGDAATTAKNVATHASLVRASVVADLVTTVTGLLTAMALYLLLKHVHANAARAIVAFLAVAAAMMALNLTHQFQALHVSDAAYTSAFGAQGSDALVLLMLDLHHQGT
jgi:negative regulator of replication initiation